MYRYIIIIFISVVIASSNGLGQTNLEKKVDSLFMIASSGALKHRDLVEPAQDEMAALGVSAVPLLIEKFDTKSAREKWTVTYTLRKIGAPAIPALINALGHHDDLVVSRVCFALGDVGDSTAVNSLSEISNHSSWQVRDQVIGALGKIGDNRASETVIGGFADSVGQVRKSAAVSAGKLAVNDAVNHLLNQLNDDFYGARMTALEALLQLDTSLVISTIKDSIAALSDLSGDLCCDVLGQIGGDKAIELLMEQTYSIRPERRSHASIALITADPLDNCGYQQRIIEHELDRLVLLKIQSTLYSVQHVQ